MKLARFIVIYLFLLAVFVSMFGFVFGLIGFVFGLIGTAEIGSPPR